MSAGAPKTLKLFCLQQLRCESCRLHRDRPIDLRGLPARLHLLDQRHSLLQRLGEGEGERRTLPREGRGAWRAGAGGGASPADWVLPGAVSVRLGEREEVLAPGGAGAERPAQRETAHPARAAPAALRSRPGAAAALGGSRAAAAERVQVQRKGVSSSPAAASAPLRNSSAAPAAAAGPSLGPAQHPACSAAP